MKRNIFGPKVLVEVRMVSLLGGWNMDDTPASDSNEPPINQCRAITRQSRYWDTAECP